ncbi:MAG: response regulator [Planctomycetota bacterium]|jgi:DNA-binding NarL/FixJ family response regulator
MADTIRVVIADDHPLFRDGVVNSLDSEPDIAVVGQAASGEAALNLVEDLLPDLLLLDITMPGVGGIEIARRVSTTYPVTDIVMLTVSENHDNLIRALKAGARGYVVKGVSAPELVEIVRAVANGEAYISPALANNVLFEMTHEDTASPLDVLTEREREILVLVSQGLRNREIAEQLHLAEKTIRTYMSNVLQKLHVRSRVEAVLFAQRHGLNRDEQ